MRLTLSLVALGLGLGLSACATDPGTDSATSDLQINPSTDGAEPAYLSGNDCQLVFPGGLTSSTQTYAIWAIGSKGIGAEGDPSAIYTDKTPNLYAVFGTNAAQNEVHHVAGYDAYDHYHVLDSARGNDDQTGNKDWDLYVLVPGPNYNAATYQSATSSEEVLAQSAAGVLSPVFTPTQAFGLPGLVLHAPIKCN